MNILYIHGMGGGADSRIPAILDEALRPAVRVVCRTYSFDPEAAAAQIAAWVEELHPAVVIGESLGACHALRVRGVPHILVSPSLGAPLYLGYLAFLALIPGVPWLLGRIYKPREGDRQKLDFRFEVLRKYREHRRLALATAASSGDSYFAFFGRRDHYRRSGIVSLRAWRRHFGDTFAIYDGTHFMEEEFIQSMLLPRIIELTKK